MKTPSEDPLRHALCVAVSLVLSALLIHPPIAAPQTTSEAQNSLVDQLKSPDAKLRTKAAREIGKSGDASAIPALYAALTDPSDKVREEVVLALGQIHDPGSVNALVTATHDTNPEVRGLAVQALTGYYSGQNPTTGFTGFVKKSSRWVRGEFQADNTRIDPGVAVDPKVVGALVDVLNDSRSIKSAREAAKGLGILVAQAAVPDLVKAAHSVDEELARESLNALSKIKDKSAGPQLIDLLDSALKEIQRDAAVTLGVLRTSEALPKLQAMFVNDPDAKNKEKALEGLAYLGDPVSIPLFTKALWSEKKAFRTSAAEGLGRAGDPKALSELEKAVAAEKDAAVRLAMRFAITSLGKEDYLSAVIDELGSKLHGEAAQAYLLELSHDSRFVPKLYPYLNHQDAAVRKRLCTILMFNGDPTSIEHLERLARDPKGEVASEALRALRAVRARSPASQPSSGIGPNS